MSNLKNNVNIASSYCEKAEISCNSFKTVGNIKINSDDSSNTMNDVHKIVDLYNTCVNRLISRFKSDFNNVKFISENFERVDQNNLNNILGIDVSSDDIEKVEI